MGVGGGRGLELRHQARHCRRDAHRRRRTNQTDNREREEPSGGTSAVMNGLWVGHGRKGLDMERGIRIRPDHIKRLGSIARLN